MSLVEKQLLAREAVIVGLPSVSKTSAIEFVGSLLAERGHVGKPYIDAMLEREKTVSTFLGNGVAMPHGTFESRDEVRSTGIVVAQYPDGIDWGAGTAHLIIGLAAVGEDHVAILSHMADVLQNKDVAKELWTTANHDRLYSVLTTITLDEDHSNRIDRSVVISSEGGLHARPASLVVELAKSFDGAITIGKDGKTAKATSIMSVLSLGVAANDEVELYIDSEDADAARAAADELERILTTPEGDL